MQKFAELNPLPSLVAQPDRGTTMWRVTKAVLLNRRPLHPTSVQLPVQRTESKRSPKFILQFWAPMLYIFRIPRVLSCRLELFFGNWGWRTLNNNNHHYHLHLCRFNAPPSASSTLGPFASCTEFLYGGVKLHTINFTFLNSTRGPSSDSLNESE